MTFVQQPTGGLSHKARPWADRVADPELSEGASRSEAVLGGGRGLQATKSM